MEKMVDVVFTVWVDVMFRVTLDMLVWTVVTGISEINLAVVEVVPTMS